MPPVPLYLDTARLGQMSPTAQRLSTAFIRLSAEEPFNLYCEKFLKDGFESWPERYRRRFAGLRGWGGIEQLRRGIRRSAGTNEEASVLLASRSLSLVKAAATALFGSCRRLLTTDLSWPSYQHVLVTEAKRLGRQVITVAVRDAILSGGLTADALGESLAAAFLRKKCDALFLPAVDNLGVRVPIATIVHRIERCASIRFILTDAAQALAHVPLEEVCRHSSLVVAGCHKWVRGYYPLGVGIVGGRAEGNTWRTHFREAASEDDPLTGFLWNLETGRFAQHLETVNLGPLFSCHGALEDLRELDFAAANECHRQSASQVRRIAADAGCCTVELDRGFRSGIQLVECGIPNSMNGVAGGAIEQRLMHNGIIASAYDGGLLRISLPRRPLNALETARLRRGLAAACDEAL